MTIEIFLIVVLAILNVAQFIGFRRFTRKLVLQLVLYKERAEGFEKQYHVLTEQYRQLDNINKAFREVTATKLSIKNKK